MFNRFYHSKYSRIAAIALCAALTLSCTFGVAYAAATGTKLSDTQDTADTVSESKAETAAEKDEVVYVLAGADGEVQKVIVSDWIKNQLKSDTLTDVPDLVDPENVKGDETYTMNGENMRVWDAKGSDIYCQGSVEKELPVELRVSYTLDGKQIAPAELAGKSGKVSIHFTYQNKQVETVEIDGEKQKIYVPFAMLTGVLLDNDRFTNVNVTNGKLVNDGSHTAVLGLAFPGLQSNLAIDPDAFSIPESITISADVTDFSLTNTVTIATNEIFNQVDTTAFDSIDTMTASLGDLKDAMAQLMNGSSKLYMGLDTLLGKSNELIAGIDRLAAGAEKLNAGTEKIDAGATGIEAGAEKLKEGLTAATQNNDTLNAAANQTFAKLLETATAGLVEKGLDAPALNAENFETVLLGVESGLEGKIAQLTPAAAAYPGSVYETQLAQVKAGLVAVKQVHGELTGYKAFCDGLAAYTAGVSQAADGASDLAIGSKALKSGTAELLVGMKELYGGLYTLQEKTPELKTGVTELCDGALQLSDGVKKFNAEGVQPLVDAVDGNIGSLVTRVKATIDVSKEYRSFSGLADGTDGQVKFIYRTDAIEK